LLKGQKKELRNNVCIKIFAVEFKWRADSEYNGLNIGAVWI
jgi:hypothetical protein